MICIYKITNIKNNKIYIGSSKNFEKRKKRHLKDLELQRHHNQHLQRAYNKYSKEDFIFESIEDFVEYDQERLFKREKYWINALKPQYNIGGVGGGDNISNHPDKENIKKKIIKNLEKSWANPTKKFGSENSNWRGGRCIFTCPLCSKQVKCHISTKRNTCSDCRDRTGKNNPFYGKKHSEETMAKIIAKNTGKRNPNCHKAIITDTGKYYECQADAAKDLKVSAGLITYRLKKGMYKYA